MALVASTNSWTSWHLCHNGPPNRVRSSCLSKTVMGIDAGHKVRDISSSRSVDAILKDLLDPLEASEIAFMIQIILRDLAPLLYSPPTTCTKSLLDFTSTSYRAIEVDQALKLWHEEGSSMYCITHDLDHVAFALESMHCE